MISTLGTYRGRIAGLVAVGNDLVDAGRRGSTCGWQQVTSPRVPSIPNRDISVKFHGGKVSECVHRSQGQCECKVRQEEQFFSIDVGILCS